MALANQLPQSQADNTGEPEPGEVEISLQRTRRRRRQPQVDAEPAGPTDNAGVIELHPARPPTGGSRPIGAGPTTTDLELIQGGGEGGGPPSSRQNIAGLPSAHRPATTEDQTPQPGLKAIEGGGEGGPPSRREDLSVVPPAGQPAAGRIPVADQPAQGSVNALPQRRPAVIPMPLPGDIPHMGSGAEQGSASEVPNYVPQTAGPGERQSPGGVILPQERRTREPEASEPVEVEKSPYDEPDIPAIVPEDEAQPASEDQNASTGKPSFMDRLRRNKGRGAPDRDELADQEKGQPGREKAADASAGREKDRLGRGYRPSSQDEGKSRFRNLFNTRRKKILGGGGIAGTIIGLFFGFSVLQGPFQFIHFAQLLRGFHLTSQEDAGDDRVGRFYRFVRSSGDFGETRVGWLGSKMKTKMLADLDRIGLKPEYGGYKTFRGFTIDTENPNSPYKDMNKDQVRARLAEKGITEGVKVEGNKVFVDADKGYFKQTRALRAMVSELGYGKISTAIRVRPLQKYGLVTWHPLKRLDKKLNKTVAEAYEKWKADREEKIKKGTQIGEIDPEKAQLDDGETDRNGNKNLKDVSQPKTTLPPEKTSSVLTEIQGSKSLKITGGVAAAVGVVCVVKAVNDNIGEIRKINIIDPLIRIGTGILTIGQQIMSGQDVDQDTLSFVKKSFDGVSTKGKWSGTGAKADAKKDGSTSAFSAASIQAESGQKQNGLDIDEGIKENIAGPPPSWLSWTREEPIRTICSTAGGIITGIISAAVSVISGGIVSFIGGTIVSALAAPLAIDKISHLVAGQVVNVAAVGAEFGNYANYGLRLMGNAVALMMGGGELSKAQENALRADERQERLAEFRSQSLGHRLFNPYDPDSAVSKLIDSSQPGISNNIASLGNFFINGGKSLLKIGDIFTSKAKADEKIDYDYGFPKYGFSKEDLGNPLVEDPYENADAAAQILNSSNGQKYRDRAKKCFGVEIKKLPEAEANNKELWNVLPADTQANPYDPYNYPKDCGKTVVASSQEIPPSDPNWLRIRFFIFDTGVIEGWACFNDDETSCQNNGFESITSTSTSGTAGPITNLGGQTLAAGPQKWIQWIGQNVVPNLPGSANEKADLAATVTWWSLKEADLDVANPLSYSNCGNTSASNDCPSGTLWQVGIAGVQVPSNPSAADIKALEDKARSLHPGQTIEQILGQVAEYAGYSPGSSEYNGVVNSTGRTRASWLLRDPVTGFVTVRPAIEPCLTEEGRKKVKDQGDDWCRGYGSAAHVAKDVLTTNAVIAELKAYFQNSGSVATGPISSGSNAQLAQKLLDYKDSGKYNCDNQGDCTDLEKIVNGQSLAGSAACQAQTLDPRVLKLMLYLIETGNFTIGTFALCGDHKDDGPRGHSGGYAVDISTVNGVAINQSNAKPTTLEMMKFLNQLPGELRPRQLINAGYGDQSNNCSGGVYDDDLMALEIPSASYFGGRGDDNACHKNHIHVGY